MSRHHVSKSPKSRRARRKARGAIEVGDMLDEPIATPRGRSRRAARVKKRLFSTFCWFGVTAALTTGVWILFHRAFYDNPEFALKHLEIETDGTLTDLEIMDAISIPAQINLLKVDLAGIDERLRKFSQVKDVHVKRRVPDTLEITLRERTPLAWLGHQGGKLDMHVNGILLDDEGHAICCRTLLRKFYDFPVILVPSQTIRNQVHFGKPLIIPSVHTALELIRRWPSECPDPNLRPTQIDASREYRIDVDCLPEMRLQFSPENLTGQFLKLADALRHANATNRYFVAVNLTIPDNIPVIYHQNDFSPELPRPGAPHPSERERAPRWQTLPGAPQGISQDEMEAILSIDS